MKNHLNFKTIYSTFVFIIFLILSYTISFLFVQLTPFVNLQNMYDANMVYVLNYSRQKFDLSSLENIKLYKFDYVEYNNEVYLKIVMNENASKYGIAFDDSDTLYIEKGNLNLETSKLYSNNKYLPSDYYIDYSNIVIDNAIINVNISIDYLEVDENLTLEESSLAIIPKDSVVNQGSISNSRYTETYVFDGDGFKNIIQSKYMFKTTLIFAFSILTMLTLFFSLSNLYNSYIKTHERELIIKNIYYKNKRNLINEYVNKNFVISVPIIFVSMILGFLLNKYYNAIYFMIAFLIYVVLYYLILRIVISKKIKKINIVKDVRAL